MNLRNWIFLLLLIQTIFACRQRSDLANTSADAASSCDEGSLVDFVQINDVYEIDGVHRGELGSLSRVAALKNLRKSKNPNTFLVLSGDFMAPSAMASAVINGHTLAGAQMIDALNAIPVDFATLGNHEFDFSGANIGQLEQRLAESKFTYVSSNVQTTSQKINSYLHPQHIIQIPLQNGKMFRIAMIGLTTDSNHPQYVSFESPLRAATRELATVQSNVDAVVLLTHLSLDEDKVLASQLPGVSLIMGGHEHEGEQYVDKMTGIVISKAESNAKTSYVNQICLVQGKAKVISSQSVALDSNIQKDPRVEEVVQNWVRKIADYYRQVGFNYNDVIANVPTALDGRDESIRTQATNLTDLILKSFQMEFKDGDLFIFPVGGVRVDDWIGPGPVIVYDVLRMIPYPDVLVEMTVPGPLVAKILDNVGKWPHSGDFMQIAGAKRENDHWNVGQMIFNPAKSYRVVTNSYVAKGNKNGLTFLGDVYKDPKSGVKNGCDIRQCVIKAFRGN